MSRDEMSRAMLIWSRTEEREKRRAKQRKADQKATAGKNGGRECIHRSPQPLRDYENDMV